MLADMYDALQKGTKVLENKEAVLLYMENGWSDWKMGVEVKPGEYLSICKKPGWSQWLGDFEIYKSTKGNFQRCKKAYEKYSPNEMEILRRTAGLI